MSRPSGYAALISVVMVMLTITAIGFSLTILSVDHLLTTLRYDQGISAQALADSCAYDVALQLRNQGLGYVGSHTIKFEPEVIEDEVNCVVEVTNTIDTTVTVTIDARWHDDHRKVEQTMDVSNATMLLWQEVGE